MKGFLGIRRLAETAARIRRRIGSLRPGTVNIRPAWQWIRKHRLRLAGTAGAIGLVAVISYTGHYYVKSNTFEVYHVFVGDEPAGTVSAPEVVEQYILSRQVEWEKAYPGVHMVMNDDDIELIKERAFKAQSDDAAAIEELDRLIVSRAVGFELKVGNEVVGIVKDEATAESILQQIKEKYTPRLEKNNEVAVLSAEGKADEGKAQVQLENVDFVEPVSLERVETTPESIARPEYVLAKLQEEEVQGIQYTVVEGDCVTCIAEKLDISTEHIYEKNPETKDNYLQIGQVLDLTERIPKLSVKATLIQEEVHDVHYDTIYQTDDTLKLGKTVVVREGKEGKKKVTYRVTQINGKQREMEIIDEEILVPPVPAIVKKGTKVIPGEGTGKFAWPVVGATITSGYGERWGSTHKGLDMISKNKNIIASDNGKVVFAGTRSGYGKTVIIDHNNGYRTLYGHLSKISVSVGTTVEKGEIIGVMGSTGNSTGVHLHFEIHSNGVAQNPMKYLSR
jgi:murein DD-endopeptidase MepM/ murein hydrolase activator NlpD